MGGQISDITSIQGKSVELNTRKGEGSNRPAMTGGKDGSGKCDPGKPSLEPMTTPGPIAPPVE